jgi:uncharacterized membrane protein YbhN (UPF0104 family)
LAAFSDTRTDTPRGRVAPPSRGRTDERAETRSPRGWKVWAKWASIVLALALTAWLLHRTLSKYSVDEILDALKSLPVGHLGLAGLFAAASYGMLTLFDTLAVRYVGHRLPYRKVAFTSFVSLSIGHSVGLAGLSSGAIRYRYYSRWGLSMQEVAKVILFTGLTVGIGLMALAGIALAANTALAAEMMGVSRGVVTAVAVACLLGTVGYLGAAWYLHRPIPIWRWSLEIPTLKTAVLQVVVGVVNFALVAACLHQCISGIADVPYLSVAAVYVSANVATLITHVPGGLGVIESVTLFLVPAQKVIGAVIAFRVIYFLIPLAIGGLTFLATELVLRRRKRPA